MSKVNHTTKICKIDPSRGWASGMYEIVRYGDSECEVKHITTGLRDIIYRAHLLVDFETIRYQKQWRKDRAAKIGKAALDIGMRLK